MFQIRKENMIFVCMTVGLALVASKYRNNVLRSVRQFCQNILVLNKSLSIEKKFRIVSDKVILVDSPEKCDYALQRIRDDLTDGVLGFDCEWVNEDPICLLQLATTNGLCVLFRLSKIGYVPSKLKELLANKRVLKVGVAPFDDGRKLTRDFGCYVFGTLDLRELARKLGLANAMGLASLSKEYLGIEMDKTAAVRRSNWNADTLTEEQIIYAASDAVASVLIYHQMLKRATQQQSLWGNFVINLKNLWDQSEEDKLHNLPQGDIDVRFRTNPNNAIHKDNQGTNHNINLKVKSKISIPTRNKPLYHNCYLQAPDGETLCTCDQKKAEWYVEKGLGTVVNQVPYTVRLKFEPSGRAQGEVGQYYTQIKVNRCVVCGSTEKFIRKNVIPREYRKYFPVVMKEHQSHDVLLLCPACHQRSNIQDVRMRNRLAEMCNAPLSGPSISLDDAYQSHWRRLRSAVRALRKEPCLPEQRRLILESHVLELTGHKEVTTQLLEELDQQIRAEPIPSMQMAHTPHGLKVVEYFENQPGGLVELEQLWREHFLSSMKPQYMPELWSVSHNQERLLIRLQQRRIEPKDARIAGILENKHDISSCA